MTNKKQRNHQKPVQQQIKPSLRPEIKDDSEQPKEAKQAHDDGNIKDKPYSIIIENKDDRAAKTIAIVSIAVNIILVVATFLLYKEASIQSKSSVTSSVATVGYLREIQKQFIQENQPNLQVGDFSNFNFKDGYFPKFNYQISSISKQPVEILRVAEQIKLVVQKDSASFINNPFKDIPKYADLDFYITKETPGKKFFASVGSRTPLGEVDGVKKGRILVYYITQYEYINYITNKTRKYQAVVNMVLFGNNLGYRYIYNKNEDEK